MYSISEEYAKKIISDDRAFSVRLTFSSSTVLTGTTIQDISLDEVVVPGDSLTLGCACSNKIAVNLINPPTDIVYGEATFIAEVGLLLNGEYEYVPLGKFYVTEPETNNDFKNLKLTAYDGFCKMTGKYIPAIEKEEPTIQDVYDDLKAQIKAEYGITLKDLTCPNYPIEVPNLDITHQQAISYVAGCLGGFARFDRRGELEIASYTTTDITIDRNIQYMSGFKRTTDKKLSITSITTGTTDNVIVRGDGANGTVISFENPYITDSMADAVFVEFNGTTYTPCQLKWRGNPAIQAGDIVYAIDKNGDLHNVFVMSQNIKIDGGLSSTIDCKGKSETTSNFSNNFETTGQKLDRIYKELEQTIIDATNAITGNTGGYVKILDTNNDNSPDEIVISDLPILESDDPEVGTATKVWRWNKEGLGYAENINGNAYRGPYRTAITADGKINADFITTGLLSADRIRIGDEKFGDYIHIEDGVIHFNNKDDPMSLRLGNIEALVSKKVNATFSVLAGDTGTYTKPLVRISGNTYRFEDEEKEDFIVLETENAIPELVIGNIYKITINNNETASVEYEAKEKTRQLAFFDGDKRIAYFSNNSFEIENLTEGKIRFQNFGFIPRASGNLTFTKLI